MNNRLFYAGAGSLTTLQKFLLENEIISEANLHKYNEATVNNFLFTIYDCLPPHNTDKDKYFKSMYEKGIKHFQSILDNVGFSKTAEFVYDSGAYQIQQESSNLKEEDYLRYNDTFMQVLEYFSGNFRAPLSFPLEIVPNNYKTLSSDTIYNLNKNIYKVNANQSQGVVDRTLAVTHFKDNRLWEAFKRLDQTEGIRGKFTRRSVGGLVFGIENEIKPLLQGLPIIAFLQQVLKEKNYDSNQHYHLLGVSSVSDVMAISILECLAKKLYKINLRVTYDSSSIVQSTNLGRYCDIIRPDGRVCRISLRSDCEHEYLCRAGNMTSVDVYNEWLLPKLNQCNFKFKKIKSFYKDDDGNELNDIRPDIRASAVMYAMFFETKKFDDCYKVVEQMIDNSLENRNPKKFIMECQNLIVKFSSSHRLSLEGRGKAISLFELTEAFKSGNMYDELHSYIYHYMGA